MLPLPPFSLLRPRSIQEAVALLVEHPGARLLAGGTDLVPNLKHGLVDVPALVSLSRIDGLHDIREDDGQLHVGAMCSLEQVTDNELVRSLAPALAEAALSVAGPHHRRMGTLGGNINLDTRCRYYNQTHFWRSALGYCLKKDGTVCHVVAGGQKCVAAASNDTAPALLALGAQVTLVGPGGHRTMPLCDFYTADGIKNTVLGDAEILTDVVVPSARLGRRSAFEKLRRRNAIDFPLLSIAARADLEDGGVRALEVWVSALAAKPRRLEAARRVAAGTRADGALVVAIAEAARRECKPLDNVEGDAEWRREMVPVFVRRVLERVLGNEHETAASSGA